MTQVRWWCGLFVVAVACSDGSETKPGSGDGPGAASASGDTGAGDAGGGPDFDAVGHLERLLVGFYDSSEQASSSPDYYNILLTMCPVPLPELGMHVLYVEQASADTPRSPYRQRLYSLEPGASETQAVSRVYELAGPGTFVGACDDADAFEIDMERVLLLEGCDVTLDWDGARFVGGTEGDACGTDFGGATYATSEIVLDETVLLSWDRGYDDRGRQVWGATGGGYQFIRHTELGSW